MPFVAVFGLCRLGETWVWLVGEIAVVTLPGRWWGTFVTVEDWSGPEAEDTGDDWFVMPAAWRVCTKLPVRAEMTRRSAALAWSAWAVALGLAVGEVGLVIVGGELHWGSG